MRAKPEDGKRVIICEEKKLAATGVGKSGGKFRGTRIHFYRKEGAKDGERQCAGAVASPGVNYKETRQTGWEQHLPGKFTSHLMMGGEVGPAAIKARPCCKMYRRKGLGRRKGRGRDLIKD